MRKASIIALLIAGAILGSMQTFVPSMSISNFVIGGHGLGASTVSSPDYSILDGTLGPLPSSISSQSTTSNYLMIALCVMLFLAVILIASMVRSRRLTNAQDGPLL